MQGHIIGVDEFLELCKHWKRITDKFPEGWVDPKPKARQMVGTKLYKCTGHPAPTQPTYRDARPHVG